jgi:hypothetical protein
VLWGVVVGVVVVVVVEEEEEEEEEGIAVGAISLSPRNGAVACCPHPGVMHRRRLTAPISSTK